MHDEYKEILLFIHFHFRSTVVAHVTSCELIKYFSTSTSHSLLYLFSSLATDVLDNLKASELKFFAFKRSFEIFHADALFIFGMSLPRITQDVKRRHCVIIKSLEV